MYDDLLIDAPFWPKELLEIDMTPFPKAAVSALAGFHLGDEIQMIEGLGTPLGGESAETCGQVSAVAGAISSLGVMACSLITNVADKNRCIAVVAGAGSAAPGIIQGAMDCGTRTPTGTIRVQTGAEVQARLAAERHVIELEAQARINQAKQEQTQQMLLIGGGVAVAAALAFIALRR